MSILCVFRKTVRARFNENGRKQNNKNIIAVLLESWLAFEFFFNKNLPFLSTGSGKVMNDECFRCFVLILRELHKSELFATLSYYHLMTAYYNNNNKKNIGKCRVYYYLNCHDCKFGGSCKVNDSYEKPYAMPPWNIYS